MSTLGEKRKPRAPVEDIGPKRHCLGRVFNFFLKRRTQNDVTLRHLFFFFFNKRAAFETTSFGASNNRKDVVLGVCSLNPLKTSSSSLSLSLSISL